MTNNNQTRVRYVTALNDFAVVSVVVCTRNRGDGAAKAVESVLANTDVSLDILVVDQSDDDVTELSIGLLSAQGVRYIRTASRGLSRARNVGLQFAVGEIVLMTDDDCIVPPTWVRAMAESFESSSLVSLVFGDVHAAAQAESFFTPASLSSEPFRLSSLRDWRAADGMNIGIGASMGVRRSAALQLGGFDPELGAGATFRSAEDTDITVRFLLRNHEVVRIVGDSVEHLGARSHLDGRKLVRDSMYGVGACYGKLLRCLQFRVIAQVVRLYWTMLICPIFISLRKLEKPPVLGRFVHLHKGLYAGIMTPVERRHCLFRDEPSSVARDAGGASN